MVGSGVFGTGIPLSPNVAGEDQRVLRSSRRTNPIVSLEDYNDPSRRVIRDAVHFVGNSVLPQDTDRPLGKRFYSNEQSPGVMVDDWEYGARDGQFSTVTSTIDEWSQRYGEKQIPPYSELEIKAFSLMCSALVSARDI